MTPTESDDQFIQELLTVRQAAKEAKISYSLLYKCWGQNEGPRKIKIGRRTLIHREDLNDWIRQLREKANG